MKTPRTITILKLLVQVVSGFLSGQRLMLRGSLAKLDKLGGIYIKFLQIVVLNLDPAEQENFRELLAVYEHSSPDNLEIRHHLLTNGFRDLGAFAEIDAVPFRTGSLGQVYRAKLISGQPVIIKVLRPSVTRYLRYDLRLIGLLSFVYRLLDRQHMIDFRQVYRQLKNTCLQETDYQSEAEAADYYYQQYREHARLVIPKTYLELSNNRVIVQDYIDGLSVADLLAIQSQGADARKYVSDNLGSDLLSQLYTVGYELLSKAVMGEPLQADPHPGNIILLPDNKVALIDFGMMTQLTSNRLGFYQMLVQYRQYYSGNLAIEDFALAALRFLAPKLYAAIDGADKIFNPGWQTQHSNMIERVRRATVDVSRDETTAQVIEGLLQRKMIMKVLFFAINRGNRFGFTFDLSSVTLLKAAQTYMSLAGHFDPDAVAGAKVVADVVALAERNLDKIIDSRPVQLQPAEALEILSKWFDKMARNDPWLMTQMTEGYLR